MNILKELEHMRPISRKADKQILASQGGERALSVLRLPDRRSLDAQLSQREGLLRACGSCEKLNLPRNPRVVESGEGYLLIEEMALCSPEGPAESYASDLIQAIGQMHGCGWVHMDIKPEHLLWDGRSYLLHDFDGAMPVGTRFRERDITWAYAPPDVLWHTRADVSDDLYAAALVLYRLRNGSKLPYERRSENRAALRRMLAPSVYVPEAWGREAQRFFQSALSWRRSARFQSAEAFSEAFAQVELTWKAGE